MPGTSPYNLMSDNGGGSTIQVKTADGSLATAQLVTVPNNSVQNGGGSNNTNNGITLANASSSIPNWVIDTSSTPTTSRSNNPTNNSSSM